MSLKTAPLDHHLVLPLTHLEYIFLVYLSYLQGHNPDEWVRRLLKDAVKNELHSALKNELLGRVSQDAIEDE